MVTKKEYQKVESKMMMLDSENRELKYTMSNMRNKLQKIIKELNQI